MTRVRRKTEIKTLDPESVPEVRRFLEAQEALEAFKEDHPELMEELREISREYNAAEAAAEKMLRQQEASCGPFEVLHVVNKYDMGALYEQLGEEDFVRFGGKVRTVEVYEMDKTVLESFIASGQIPDEIVDAVRTRIVSYKKIPKVQLP